MKARTLFICIIFMLAAFMASAQQRYVHLYVGGNVVYSAPTADNIEVNFAHDSALFVSNGSVWSTLINSIDSMVFSTTEVNVVTVTTDTAICDGASIDMYGTTLSAAGVYTFSGNDDTVYVVNLTVNPTYNDTITVDAMGSYTWADSIFTESTIYTFTGSTVAGCDSLVTLVLTIDTTSPDTASAVYITWNGTNVSVTNPFTSLGVSVSVSSGDVTVTSTSDSANLTYVLSGTSSAGSLTFSSNKKAIVYLDNLTLTANAKPAITITSSKKTTIVLTGTSTLSDDSSNSLKGTMQNKGKFDFQGTGILNIYAYAKHGIQSGEETEVNSGTINVLTAVKDGLNVNSFIMTGGTVNVTNSNGDGIDGDEGLVQISGGNITVNCSASDVKGLACDSTLTISGGTINITVSGDQSKGIKTDQDLTISGGNITVNATGTVVLESSGSGYDPSYCSGIKSEGNITVSGGSTTVVCSSANAGGKAITCDGNINISAGTLNLTAAGSSAAYTDSTGTTDTYKSAGMKSDSQITISGGNVTVTAGGRGIMADGGYTQTGGNVQISVTGSGFTTIGSGTSCSDGFAPACLKSDGNIVATAGTLSCTASGTGGRGIVSDLRFIVGATGANDSLVFVYATTSGAPVNASSSGGGMPGGSSSDYWKGLPKAIKIDSSIYIRSGHVQAYCSQTSGDPTGEALESKDSILISGGYVETNAYDDAINASAFFHVSGGSVWAYSRGNDAIDCNGSQTRISGGTVIAISASECGIDDNADAGGSLVITGGTLIAAGSMGGTEGTPSTSGQKYLSLGGNSGGGPGGGGPGGGSGGGSTSVSVTNGFCIKNSSSTTVLTFKAPSVSGSGFVYSLSNFSNAPSFSSQSKEGGSGNGIIVSSPSIQSGTYTYYTSPTISGGSNWHGLYSGATVSTSGSGTSVTAQ